VSVPSAHEVLATRELGQYGYLDALRRIHSRFAPATYLEIGSYRGRSLTLVGPHTDAIGVDPVPKIDFPLTPRTRMVRTTSDAFFAAWDQDPPFGGRPVDLGFIDGMHLSEVALRDFTNLERRCRPDSVILLHDCYPLDEATAARERTTVFWSGDIWRTILALRKYRPDLDVTTLAVPPTGLGIVGHLDPGSPVLHTRYEEIVANMLSWPFANFEPHKREALHAIEGTEANLDGLLDRPRAPR
jgi:hypothetical protein